MASNDNIDITISDENIVITTLGSLGAPGVAGATGADGADGIDGVDGSGATELTELTDVTLTNATTGEVLVFAGSPAIAINRLLLETDISNFGSYSLTSHDHTGVYEPANANLLETADIGVSVQGYDANTVIDAAYVQTELSFTTALKTNYDAAYTHSISAHAPTDADNTAANETSHADVLVDGEFITAGLMKTDGAGNYSIDANAYSLTTHVHEGTEIDATAVTDGFVLTADGLGNSAWEASAGGTADRNVDGGVSTSVYLPSQIINGGSA